MNRVGSRSLAGAVAFALFAIPSLAQACPMCFSGGGANDNAFFWGSVFMIVVPVTVLGGLGYLAVRRIRVVDERNARGLARDRARGATRGLRSPAPSAQDSQPVKQT